MRISSAVAVHWKGRRSECEPFAPGLLRQTAQGLVGHPGDLPPGEDALAFKL
jgi:hypothetical protein